MKNNKGFSLVEIMTVVIILGILASLSIPFVLGYVRDAKNDRAKAVLTMVAQGYKNFKNEFSYLTLSNTNNGAGPLTKDTSVGTDSNIDSCHTALGSIQNNSITYNFLIKCSFLQNIDYSKLQYNFYLGSSSCTKCGNTRSESDLACMEGTDPVDSGSDYCTEYCAFIDQNNNLHEFRNCGVTTTTTTTTP